jgi:hypothetical protein
MLFAALVALVLLTPAAYATYQAATAPPAGGCSAEDCPHCAALFGTCTPAAERAGKAGDKA